MQTRRANDRISSALLHGRVQKYIHTCDGDKYVFLPTLAWSGKVLGVITYGYLGSYCSVESQASDWIQLCIFYATLCCVSQQTHMTGHHNDAVYLSRRTNGHLAPFPPCSVHVSRATLEVSSINLCMRDSTGIHCRGLFVCRYANLGVSMQESATGEKAHPMSLLAAVLPGKSPISSISGAGTPDLSR